MVTSSMKTYEKTYVNIIWGVEEEKPGSLKLERDSSRSLVAKCSNGRKNS